MGVQSFQQPQTKNRLNEHLFTRGFDSNRELEPKTNGGLLPPIDAHRRMNEKMVEELNENLETFSNGYSFKKPSKNTTQPVGLPEFAPTIDVGRIYEDALSILFP